MMNYSSCKKLVSPYREPHGVFQIIVLDFSVSAQGSEDEAVPFGCCSIYSVESFSLVALPSLPGKAGKVFRLQDSFRWVLSFSGQL